MNLYLVQHGTAVEKAVNPDRPLSPVGVADVNCIAAVLARAGIAPARILHSGKTRATETAMLFGERLAGAGPPAPLTGIAPNDSVEDFAATIATWNDDVLICGHQPFMGRLASFLLCGDAKITTLKYSPGSAASLARDDAGEWRLCWFLRPEVCAER